MRDDWQHLGLGKPLLAKIVDIGKTNGISIFESLIAPQNEVIKALLTDLGYKVTYSLRSGSFLVEIHV